jgi:myo-inositol-hexaphosphate 3-phosphohydrolase
VTYKDGTVELWAVSASPLELAGQLVKTVKLETQLEGCVFDESQGLLFVGEEDRGLWKMSYRDEAPVPELIDEVGGAAWPCGRCRRRLPLARQGQAGWIVASAQSANRFVVYDRKRRTWRWAVSRSARTRRLESTAYARCIDAFDDAYGRQLSTSAGAPASRSCPADLRPRQAAVGVVITLRIAFDACSTAKSGIRQTRVRS